MLKLERCQELVQPLLKDYSAIGLSIHFPNYRGVENDVWLWHLCTGMVALNSLCKKPNTAAFDC